jgi:hypothetical protein
LLGQHAHICLELEKPLKSFENSTNYIQYANELWMSTVVLNKTIASKSRETFELLTIDSSDVLAEALCAIYLLEQTNLKDLFNEFLTSRTVRYNFLRLNSKTKSRQESNLNFSLFYVLHWTQMSQIRVS